MFVFRSIFIAHAWERTAVHAHSYTYAHNRRRIFTIRHALRPAHLLTNGRLHSLAIYYMAFRWRGFLFQRNVWNSLDQNFLVEKFFMPSLRDCNIERRLHFETALIQKTQEIQVFTIVKIPSITSVSIWNIRFLNNTCLHEILPKIRSYTISSIPSTTINSA